MKHTLLTALAIIVCSNAMAQSGWLGRVVPPSGGSAPSGIPTNQAHYWAFTGITGTNDLVGSDNVILQQQLVSTNGVKGMADTAWYYGTNATPNSFASLGDKTDLTFTTGTNTADIPFSISLWIKPVSITPTFQQLFSKSGSGTGYEYQFFLTGGKMSINLINSGFVAYLYNQTSNTIPTNAWTHLVWTYNANKTSAGIVMYTNGVVASYYTENGGTYSGMSDTAQRALIGVREEAPPNNWPFKGTLDEFRIWHRVLTQQEITDLYNAEK